MNFLAPLSLLWLLPLGGLIILLYLLRIKRRDVTVSSTLLWQQVLQDTQANAPFQKLKRNLLLVLQLLALLLFVFAVARPFLWSNGLGGKTTALVLDASASMKATDENGSRFAAAVREAETLISRKGPTDAVVLVLAGEKPQPLSPVTADKAALLRALKDAHPSDASGDMAEAIGFAASLVSSRADAQVTVLSDGAFGKLDDVSTGGAKLGFVTVGKRSENLGVTAFDVRESLGGTTGRQAFVTVQNFSKSAKVAPLSVYVNNKLAGAHEVTLRPGESKSEVFDNIGAKTGGVVRAVLEIKDDLASDNAAQTAIAPQRPLQILLVTEGNVFLERVLNLDPRVTLDAVTPKAYKPEDSARRDMTVFDGATPPANLLPGRYLFWGGAPPKAAEGTEKGGKGKGESLFPAVAAGKVTDGPQILDWSRTHPLMRFVDLANVQIQRAPQIAPAPWATTLVEGDGGPLVVAGERADTKAVYVAWGALESDMPLRVAFPIFLTNCIQWLTVQPSDTGGVSRPGEVVPLVPAPTLTITRPDGRKDTLTVAKGAPALYDKADTAGVYKAQSGDLTQYFAVSLLSPAESNVAPVKSPAVTIADSTQEVSPAPGDGKEQSGMPKRAQAAVRREVWPYLALVVLLVLSAEWLVYHRRIG